MCVAFAFLDFLIDGTRLLLGNSLKWPYGLKIGKIYLILFKELFQWPKFCIGIFIWWNTFFPYGQGNYDFDSGTPPPPPPNTTLTRLLVNINAVKVFI